MPRYLPREEPRPAEVGVEGQIELGLLKLEEAVRGIDPDVVHHQLDRAMGPPDLLGQLVGATACEVAAPANVPALAKALLEGLLVLVDRDHTGTKQLEELRYSATDSVRRPGYDCR